MFVVYDKCQEALQFHHIDPETKSFGIGNFGTKRLPALIVEAEKCILVCSNCHAEIHMNEAIEKRLAGLA